MAEVVYLGATNRRNGEEAWLYGNAGLSYLRAVADGLPHGWINDAGRTNAEQWVMWNRYKAGLLLATAAYPGTSKHETGRAIDLASGPAQTWMRQHGRKYGWMRDRVGNEPWHFEYEFWNDTQIGRGDPRKEQKVSADEVWRYGLPARHVEGKPRASTYLVNANRFAMEARDNSFGNVTISRDGVEQSAAQELADCKTLLLTQGAALSALQATLETVTARLGNLDGLSPDEVAGLVAEVSQASQDAVTRALEAGVKVQIEVGKGHSDPVAE